MNTTHEMRIVGNASSVAGNAVERDCQVLVQLHMEPLTLGAWVKFVTTLKIKLVPAAKSLKNLSLP